MWLWQLVDSPPTPSTQTISQSSLGTVFSVQHREDWILRVPRNLSNHMDRRVCTGDTVLVKSREMTGRSQILRRWLGGGGVKTTENKINWPLWFNTWGKKRMEGLMVPKQQPIWGSCSLCTYESTTAGFTSFPARGNFCKETNYNYLAAFSQKCSPASCGPQRSKEDKRIDMYQI